MKPDLLFFFLELNYIMSFRNYPDWPVLSIYNTYLRPAQLALEQWGFGSVYCKDKGQWKILSFRYALPLLKA